MPNIRFNVARLLQALAEGLEPSVVSAQVRPCLDELASDADPDVRYYAQQALAAVGGKR